MESAKTTLLEKLAAGNAKGENITKGVKVGYYRQDFSTLNFEDTVYDSLVSATKERDTLDWSMTNEKLRSVASGFLIDEHVLRTKIGSLSEGQKGAGFFCPAGASKTGTINS